MNNSVNEEKVINLKDMLYWTLKHWRKILIGAIIIALLAGSYKAYKGFRQLSSEEELAKANEKYEIALADYEATGERLRNRIENLREQSDHQQEYNEKSVLMKIDPMEKWTGDFQIYIDSKYQINPNLSYQNLDMTNRLISAYASYLKSGDLYQEILEQTPYIDEIRFLTEIYHISADPGTATISVSCVGATESDVRQMLDVVKTKFAEHYETVRNAIGDHDYDILMQSVYSTIDLGLEKTQKSNLETIAEYANAIGTSNEELTAWGKEAKPQKTFSVEYALKETIKYVVLGGIIGIVVVFLWFAVKYTLSDAIKTDDDWRGFRLPVLGHILRGEQKKKFLPGLDRLVDRIFGCTRTATMEQTCVLTAQNLGVALKERGLTTGVLVGNLPDCLSETLSQKMNSADTGVSFRFAGDALNDPAATRNLDGIGEVLIVAERYVTRCAEANQMLTLLNAWGKTALGVVVVE